MGKLSEWDPFVWVTNMLMQSRLTTRAPLPYGGVDEQLLVRPQTKQIHERPNLTPLRELQARAPPAMWSSE